MKNMKTLRIAEKKDNKTFGITEKPPQPPPPQPLQPPPPPPPPLEIKDKRTLRIAEKPPPPQAMKNKRTFGIAEKPPPTLAMKYSKNLGIAEKPLPPPPLGFLRLVPSRVKLRIVRSDANRLRIGVRLVWSLLDDGRS